MNAEGGFVNDKLKKCKYDFKLVDSGSKLDPPKDAHGNLRVDMNFKRSQTTKVAINLYNKH